MGIGRREFLRLAGLALTGLAVNPLKAVAVNDNAYVNKKLGILFISLKIGALFQSRILENLDQNKLSAKD